MLYFREPVFALKIRPSPMPLLQGLKILQHPSRTVEYRQSDAEEIALGGWIDV